jgi:AcrR family transcriptional regulator
MSRWEPDGVGRLQAAAFELFAEQGYERTTVAEIAERAGLTKRTFFNHFADKREVLFGPASQAQREAVVAAITACPPSLPPLDAVLRGLLATADFFQEHRESVIRRNGIVEANPELQERELNKQAALTDAVAQALRERGVDADTALLSARAGALVQQTAMRQWMRSESGRHLRDHMTDALAALRALTESRPSGQESSSA